MSKQLEVAKKCAKLLKKCPNIVLFLVGGSVALGYEREDSDIDADVFYKGRLPSDNKIKKCLGHGFYPLNLRNGKKIFFDSDGIGISIEFKKISLLDGWVSKYPKLDIILYSWLRTHMDSLLLFDRTGSFGSWKDKVSEFPDELKREVIIKRYTHLKAYLEDDEIAKKFKEGNMIRVHAMFYEVVMELLTILFAINNKVIYYNYPANSSRQIEDLKIKPKDFLENMDKAIKLSNDGGGFSRKIILFRELFLSIKPYIKEVVVIKD